MRPSAGADRGDAAWEAAEGEGTADAEGGDAAWEAAEGADAEGGDAATTS